MRTISVLLADSHEAYREGLARAVRADARLELVADVPDGRAALEQILALGPDVALLEVRMPYLDGLEVWDILSGLDRAVETRVALISGEVNATLASQARAMGVAAVLSKDAARGELCEMLVKIAADA
ncbi:MAG TPA: response regulator transcription factor [Thermoleophilaceae bacterium]|nr:response regulator transcription factor [Thermoleophilaceae bacterium]